MNLDDFHRERSEAAFRRNRIGLGLEADEQANRLRDHFKEVSRRIDRAVRLRRLQAHLRKQAIWIWAFLGIVGGSYIGLATASPWPMGVTVRHLLAARNCDTARAVDLAPATRGAPGYWARNDADDDGIACEPWPKPSAKRTKYASP
jgi:hypothetical protein